LEPNEARSDTSWLTAIGLFVAGRAGYNPSGQQVCFAGEAVRQMVNVNPTSEHELYLKLFITNGGGW